MTSSTLPLSLSPTAAGAAPYLSFQLGGLDYGLDFSKVKELRLLKSLERFAADGAIISGVAVSRGLIIPIVDLRVAVASCGAGAANAARTDVIILELSNCVMGMVVDGVSDVVWLEHAQIRAMPTAAADAEYLVGLGECQGRRLILVDIDRLMSIRRTAAQGAVQAA